MPEITTEGADIAAIAAVVDSHIKNNNVKKNTIVDKVAAVTDEDFVKEFELVKTIKDKEIRKKVTGYYIKRLDPSFMYLVPENNRNDSKDGYIGLLKYIKECIKVVKSSQIDLPLLLEKLNEEKKYYEDSLLQIDSGYDINNKEEEESNPSSKKKKEIV